MRSLCLALVLALGACDQLAAPQAESPLGPPAAAAAPVADLQTFAGRPFADLVAAHPDRFGNDALSLNAAESARLGQVIASGQGAVLDGGGAEALVFRGCAASGCAEGVGIVAVDAATGAAFVGVRDGDGADILVPNDRLEALLRLNATSRDWVDAGAAPDIAGEAPLPEESRP